MTFKTFYQRWQKIDVQTTLELRCQTHQLIFRRWGDVEFKPTFVRRRHKNVDITSIVNVLTYFQLNFNVVTTLCPHWIFIFGNSKEGPNFFSLPIEVWKLPVHSCLRTWSYIQNSESHGIIYDVLKLFSIYIHHVHTGSFPKVFTTAMHMHDHDRYHL